MGTTDFRSHWRFCSLMQTDGIFAKNWPRGSPLFQAEQFQRQFKMFVHLQDNFKASHAHFLSLSFFRWTFDINNVDNIDNIVILLYWTRSLHEHPVLYICCTIHVIFNIPVCTMSEWILSITKTYSKTIKNQKHRKMSRYAVKQYKVWGVLVCLFDRWTVARKRSRLQPAVSSSLLALLPPPTLVFRVYTKTGNGSWEQKQRAFLLLGKNARASWAVFLSFFFFPRGERSGGHTGRL